MEGSPDPKAQSTARATCQMIMWQMRYVMKIRLATLGLLALLISGCSQCQSSSESKASIAPPAPSAQAAIVEASEEAVNAFAEASNAFAFDLYGKWSQGSDNLAFSPVSLAIALTMTWAGARGKTASQMANVLHLPDSAKETHAAASALLRGWRAPNRGGYEIFLASRLFVDGRTTLEADFSNTVKPYYGAAFELLNLVDQPELARATINDWVKHATQQKIVDLIPQGGIQRFSALVLVNAAYFQGRWEHRFEREATVDQPFSLASGDKLQVPTMHQEALFRHGRVGGAQVLEMPYAGENLSMTLVLPGKPDGLRELEKTLSVESLRSMRGSLRREKVRVYVPRFRIDPPRAMQVKPVLEVLGMELSRGDFSGIGHGVGRLVVDEVYHRAFVDVDEAGTEAAAGSAVVLHTPAARSVPPEVPEFRADHPFLFFIRDNDSSAILFMGRLHDPSRGMAQGASPRP